MEKDIALYREKLQRYYTTGGKLAQYPQKRPMRILALSRIAQRFEPARQYAEKEVNEIIQGTDAEMALRTGQRITGGRLMAAT